MGRAIVREPQVFLMDEPLSNLDAKLRVQTRRQIAALQRRLGTTTVYVTHDQVEAMTMGDRVAVSRTACCSSSTPRASCTTSPANVFVAGFIGSPAMNLVKVPLVDGGVQLGRADRAGVAGRARRGRLRRCRRPGPRRAAGVLRLVGDAEGAIAMEVNLVEELGADAFAYTSAHVGDRDVDMILRVDARAVPMKGDTLYAKPHAHETHLFSASTGERWRSDPLTRNEEAGRARPPGFRLGALTWCVDLAR